MQPQSFGHGKDNASVIGGIGLADHVIKVQGLWSLAKFDWKGREDLQKLAESDMKNGLSIDNIADKYGRQFLIQNGVIGENLLLNAGINLLMNLLAGAGGTAYNNSNGRIGVGDSSTAASASQTGLQAASNKTYVAYDSTYPTTGSSQQFVSRATFGSSSANYSWQEFTNDNGTTSLNRLVSNQGTKTSGQTWQPTITLTIS